MHSMQFPVQVLQECGSDVALNIDRQDLLSLIHLGTVIAYGTPTRIRHLRLNRPTETISNLRLKLRTLPSAEDNKTTRVVGRTQSHHAARSGAYGPAPVFSRGGRAIHNLDAGAL